VKEESSSPVRPLSSDNNKTKNGERGNELCVAKKEGDEGKSNDSILPFPGKKIYIGYFFR
jgi:hypothetical protein